MRSRRAVVRSSLWALALNLLAIACAVAQASADAPGARPGSGTTFEAPAGVQACANDGPCHVSGTTQVFTNRAAFLAALAAGHIENAFDDVAGGAVGGLNYAENGFAYLVYTQSFAHGAPYNGRGFISTDRVDDQIVVYFFSGSPVTAIGGNFWPVDFSLRPTNGTIDLFLEDGTVETILSSGPDDFRGFITQSPFARFTIDAPDIASPPRSTSPDRWPAMDNLVIGNGQ